MTGRELWASLLQEAISGRLVEQCDDEPDVPQIGGAPEDVPFAIPEKWKWLTLKDCAEFNPKIEAALEKDVSFIPMADVAAGYDNAITPTQTKKWKQVKSGFSKFADGDVIFAKITPCFQNKKSVICTNLVNGVGAGSTEFHVLRANRIIDARFLLLLVKSAYFIAYGVENFKGTAGQKRIGAKDAQDCPIPLPPLAEQRRIVARLEELRPLVDAYGKAEAELSKLEADLPDRLRASLLQEAISGRLVEQRDDEPAVEQTGDAPEDVPFAVPEKWRWVQLRNIGKVVSGGTPKTNVTAYWQGGEIPWITPADLGRNKGNQCISHGEKYITQKGLENSSAQEMPSGSVIFSSRAHIGYVAIAGNALCTNQGCKSVIPNSQQTISKWIYYALICKTPNIQSRASGTTFLEISGGKFGETWLPLPPLAEQRRIVARLEELLPEVAALKG